LRAEAQHKYSPRTLSLGDSDKYLVQHSGSIGNFAEVLCKLKLLVSAASTTGLA